MNGTLDDFETTVNVAARIQKESRGGDIVVTDEVCLCPKDPVDPQPDQERPDCSGVL